MDEKPWAHPVTLNIPNVGDINVAGPRDALNLMLTKWPSSGDEAHEAAKRACFQALEGVPPLERSREAFVAAAVAVNIHVGSTASDP